MKTSYRKSARKIVKRTDTVNVEALPVGSASGSAFGSSFSSALASFNLSS